MPQPTSTEATILYVEDDSNDILLFRHALQRAGAVCRLQIFSDSEEAMAYLRGDDHFADRNRFPLPDLALLDLKMPRVNGFELLAWIRRDAVMCRLPIVVLSSSNHAMDIQRAYDSGANSYLVKPIDFTALVELTQFLTQYWLRLNQSPGILPALAVTNRSLANP